MSAFFEGYTLQRHNTEKNSKQIFTGKELRGCVSISHINVTVSDLYIYLIGPPILLKENRWDRTWENIDPLTDT